MKPDWIALPYEEIAEKIASGVLESINKEQAEKSAKRETVYWAWKVDKPHLFALDCIEVRAANLYKAPFRFDDMGGYIWDANNNMVADNRMDEKGGDIVVRLRGWGRIGYLYKPEELQDAVGKHIAKVLTNGWLN